MSWRPQLLLLLAAVAMATSGTPCDTGKYEFRGHCCDLCPPGFYVSKDCECSPCKPGSFTAHHNRETSCLACAECRNDQEVVAECTLDRDRRCQCKTGSFCDSPDCVENCYRCTRCDGPTLQPCNATRDTVCATQGNPQPGDPPSHNTNGSNEAAVVAACVSISIGISIVAVIVCCRKQGVPLHRQVVHWLKCKSGDSGNPSQGNTEPRTSLPSTDAERGLPTPGMDTAPLLEHRGSAEVPGAETCPRPSEDPEGGVELQVVVTRGSRATPEPTLQTQAPAAPGRPGRAGVVAPVSVLEQEYQQSYVLKDQSPEAIHTINCVFEQEVPKSNWRMFMRFVGLEENDINICEQENWGNVAEQHYQMLRRWQNRQGRAASPFRLLAALRKLQLHECLENVINKLVDAGILGSKHAEPPN